MKLIIYVLVALLGFTIPCACADSPCGSIKNIRGDVFLHRRDENIRAHEGFLIYPRDSITANENGAAGIILQDDTIICLGPGSSLDIEEFIFNPGDEQFSLIAQMLRGTFLFNSGTISRLSPGDVHIRTPEGTIAIRGTRFLVEVTP